VQWLQPGADWVAAWVGGAGSARGWAEGTLVSMEAADRYPPSPVPSDRRLWPGELPFTAFGQFGEDMLDLRVFDQGWVWVDRLGRPHLVGEMGEDYVANVIKFLEACSGSFFVGSVRRAVIQSIGDQLLFDDPGGEVLAAEVGGPSWAGLTVEEWLESTPLMRALRRRLPDTG